jgi:hypothetical protein
MDKPWKKMERDVATALGTTRVLNKGSSVPDVVTPRFAIDCKKRENLSVWSAFAEVKEKYSDHGIPVLIWAKKGVGYKRALVVMEFSDWMEAVK